MQIQWIFWPQNKTAHEKRNCSAHAKKWLQKQNKKHQLALLVWIQLIAGFYNQMKEQNAAQNTTNRAKYGKLVHCRLEFTHRKCLLRTPALFCKNASLNLMVHLKLRCVCKNLVNFDIYWFQILFHHWYSKVVKAKWISFTLIQNRISFLPHPHPFSSHSFLPLVVIVDLIWTLWMAQLPHVAHINLVLDVLSFSVTKDKEK